MERRIIAIGGGEIKNKTTLKIDEYVANLCKEHAEDRRANALFFGTASHDSMPYFNSFRKTYTSVFDIKVDVALCVYGEMNNQHIQEKIDKADCIYIGGGDTVYMLEKWKSSGLDKMILNAYMQGTIICGLSAGAICWFENMFTDYEIMRGQSSDYVLKKGLGVLEGTMSPHFNLRRETFISEMKKHNIESAYAVEDNCAIEFVNEKFTKSISAGGKAFFIKNSQGEITETEI